MPPILPPRDGFLFLDKAKFADRALVDISNLDENDEIMDTYARKRMYSLGNRLWHCDAAFNDPRGRYSMLNARSVTPGAGDERGSRRL